jgi:hypothetical protein
MGFWGKLGKGLLKAAPIAAAFIPGVGPLASMAIGAGTSALQKKISGGSWKDALKAGAVGGATGYLGAKVPVGAGKGLSPSKGFWNTAKDVAKKTGKSILAGGLTGQGGRPDPYVIHDDWGGGNKGPGWGEIAAKGVQSIFADRGGSQPQSKSVNSSVASTGRQTANTRGGVMPRGGYGYRDNPMNQLDQSFPNLSQSIFQGRQEGIRNQPFRRGYDIVTDTGEKDEQDKPITTTQRMPRIFSGGTGGRRNTRGRARQAAGY